MGTITVHRRAILLLVTFCLAAFCGEAVCAQRSGRATRSEDRFLERPFRRGDSRRETDQPARGAASGISSMLRAVLEQANAAGTLRPDEIELVTKSLREVRRNLSSFSNQEKCEYYLLSAWADYYAGQRRRAMLNAAKAAKTDPENADAKTTHIAMALVNQEFKVIMAAARGQARDTIFRESESGRSRSRSRLRSSSSSAMLDFDPDSLQLNLLGRKIGPVQLSCLNGSTLSYDPQDTILCILFWKLASDEPGSSPRRSRLSGRRDRGFDSTRSPRTSRMSMRGSGPADPSQQMQAFSDLFMASFTDPSIRFVATNLDSFDMSSQVTETLLENPWPWSHVMASDPVNSALAQFGQLGIEPPLLAITGPDGRISYAGPVTNFLPMMLLSCYGSGMEPVEKVSESLEEVNVERMQDVNSPAREDFDQSLFDRTSDANSLQGSGRGVSPGPQTQDIAFAETHRKPTSLDSAFFVAGTAKDESRTVPDAKRGGGQEQLYPKAENWYQMALFHKKSGQLPMLSQKKVVDYCRMILEHYPESPRAEEARQLLREMPEEYRKKYNVTDEEMGL